ncbi:hypothetical protein ACEQ8H_005025 [Pleosporales sp. CAS-2024a]
MSDHERPRDRYRERDSRREPRDDHRNRDRGGNPIERRNRSRSRRRDRGGRRDNPRHRSRSPHGANDGDKEPRGRGRDPPRGPRTANNNPPPPSAPTGPRRSDYAPRGGPAKPAPAPAVHQDPSPDVAMKEAAQKPEDMDDETWELKKLMGFAGFKSTKNQKVPGNDKNYAVRKDKRMEARQYMNRQGGFNRPLSPSRGITKGNWGEE